MARPDPDPSAQDVVCAPVATTPIAEVERLARERFAILGDVRRLGAERDENFLLEEEASGRRYVLKIANAAEAREVTDFQTRALLHVARTDPALAVPQVVAATDGAAMSIVTFADGRSRIVRLMTYVPGLPLHDAARSAAQCRDVGRLLGRLDRALEGYDHPAGDAALRWDLTHASTLRPWLAEIADPDRRALVERFLDAFEGEAARRLVRLRRQVIHNDFQPSNVLVDPADPALARGVIDFGDLVRAACVIDVAVACAYHVATAPKPLDWVAELVAGYHAVRPLVPDEVEVLYDLIATRLLLTAVITQWRAGRHPKNRAYILRNAPAAWRGLERLATLERGEAQDLLRRACAME